MTETQNLQPVAVIKTGGDDLFLTVEVSYPNAGVDRPCTYGISVRRGSLANRLVKAINAGVVMADAHIATDVHGQTYVAATCRVLGRRLNADLKRMGY